MFNDTYRFSVKNTALNVSKKNIAWKSDQEHKFGSDVYPKNFQSGILIGGAKLNERIPVNKSSATLKDLEIYSLFTFIYSLNVSNDYLMVLYATVE